MNNLLLADLSKLNLMDVLMSKTAIIVYAAVLAVLLIALMISLVFKDNKSKKVQAKFSYTQNDANSKKNEQKTSLPTQTAQSVPAVQPLSLIHI